MRPSIAELMFSVVVPIPSIVFSLVDAVIKSVSTLSRLPFADSTSESTEVLPLFTAASISLASSFILGILSDSTLE